MKYYIQIIHESSVALSYAVAGNELSCSMVSETSDIIDNYEIGDKILIYKDYPYHTCTMVLKALGNNRFIKELEVEKGAKLDSFPSEIKQIINKGNSVSIEITDTDFGSIFSEMIASISYQRVEIQNLSNNPISHQKIFYGAPGTGKSHKIKEILKDVPKSNIIRTTFHPDSDYSTFVGAYKPTMEKPIDKVYAKGELIKKLTEMKDGGVTYSPQKFGAKYWRSLKQLNLSDKKDILQACGMSDNYTVEFDKGMAVGEEYLASSKESRIIYSFIPQAFLNAYMQAYRHLEENVYLVIEEINRGNCAQIFGDLFQLLDRDANGVSEYSIKADSDLRAFLEEELGADNDGIKDGELSLPSNLYIFATMNTSDQSLFPIDSAFKRRWDWEYEPIKYKNTEWKIVIGDNEYSWVSFQRIVNEKILEANSSEDKMLGDYFVNPIDGIITENVLLNKILFYLWNDVCKDGDGDIFRISESEEVTFSQLYGENGKQSLIAMMDYLQVDVAEEEGGKDGEQETLVDSASTIKVNGKSVKYINAIPYMAIKEYVSLHPEKTSQEILDIWSPFKQYSMRSWVVCSKQELDSMKPEYANYSLEINCTDGHSIWVNKDGWMHNPTKQRDTIAEFIDAVNKSELGISITETFL